MTSPFSQPRSFANYWILDMDNAEELQVQHIDVDALDVLIDELRGLRKSLKYATKPARWPEIRVQYKL